MLGVNKAIASQVYADKTHQTKIDPAFAFFQQLRNAEVYFQFILALRRNGVYKL